MCRLECCGPLGEQIYVFKGSYPNLLSLLSQRQTGIALTLLPRFLKEPQSRLFLLIQQVSDELFSQHVTEILYLHPVL